MKTLMTSIGNEFYKLLIKKKYTVFLLIAIAVSFTRIGGGALVQKLSGGEITVAVGNIPVTMLGLFAEVLVPLIVFMAVTDLIATEISEGTFKAALLLPQTRMKVLTSKAGAAFLMGAAYYVILLISCFIIEAVFGGNVGEHMLLTTAAYLIDLVPLMVLVLMASVINFSAKGPTFAMFLCILIYVLTKYMVYFVEGSGGILFTAYLQWHKLWIGSTLPARALLPKAGVIIGSGVLLYGVSYILMERKEF